MAQSIIAYTSEDDRYAAVRIAAMQAARDEGATLVLYDVDAATPFAKPLPTWWSAGEAEGQVPKRLTVADLEAAGREPIARQVQEALDHGIEAYGWLPGEGSAAALAAYADEQQAELIMVPEEFEDPGLINRLRGKTAEAIEEKSHRPVVVVHADGSIRHVEHEASTATEHPAH